MEQRYDDLNREELVRLLQARDQRDATRFGLVWEANEIERDKVLNNDFVALDLIQKQSVGAAPWRNLIIEGDNYDALRYPCDPNLVWRYASELIEKDVEGLETESMEEWIRQDKIIFPDPDMKKLSSGKRWTNC